MKPTTTKLRWQRMAAGVTGAALILAPGCGYFSSQVDKLKSKAPSVPSMPSLTSVPGIPSLNLSPATQALLQAAGPLALEAMKGLAEALSRYMAERRAADEQEQERQRQQIVAAQLFYATECTQKSGASTANGGDVASLEKQADEAFGRADHAAAATALKKAREGREKASGENSPEVARLFNKEAVLLTAQGDYPQALAFALRGKTLRETLEKQAEKKDKAVQLVAALDVAESAATVGQVFRAAGDVEAAQVQIDDAFKRRSEKLGAQHLCVAQSQNMQGELYELRGTYGAALKSYGEAQATRKKLLAPDHRDLAQSASNLGGVYKAMAIYHLSERNYAEALSNRQKLGVEHPDVADSLHNLGTLYKVTGDFVRAEDHLKRALDIRTKTLGEGLAAAQSENALADLYFATGDFGQAEKHLQKALEIRSKKLPADHPQIAESQESLARLYQAKGDLAKAEAAYEKALGIWEKKFGPDHLAVARVLASVGELHVAQERFADADAKLSRARKIRETRFGEAHPDVAEVIHLQGTVRYAERDYAKAEALFRTALERRRKKLGDAHVQVAVSLSYLGATLVAEKKGDEAVSSLTRAQEIAEDLVRTVGAASSEARVDALLRFLRAQEEVVYSLVNEPLLGGASAKAAPLALSVALLRKGRSVDEAAAASRALHVSLSAEGKAKFVELRALRSEIANKKFSPAGASEGALKNDIERAEKLEAELARTSASFRAQHALPKFGEVRKGVAAALPADGALVEVLAFRDYEFAGKPKTARFGDVRYAALVLDNKGDVKSVDLGKRQVIDDGVKAFLKSVTAEDPPAAGSAALDKALVAPLLPLVKDKKKLVLSLDGQLNLLPFWALSDGKDFLIDRFELGYVTSGRDLLRGPSEGASTSVTLVAKPTFVKGAAGRVVASDETRGLEVVADDRASLNPNTEVPLSAGALRLKAAPSALPGTEEEAKAIKKLLPKAKVFLGDAATKEQLLGQRAPGILHVATHGLFRPESVVAPSNGSRGFELVGGATGERSVDPLLNSMLLLSNVGRPLPQNQGVVLEPTGLATALEVASMDLWGTQLVVLSACESGRGQVDNLGQGVYGLRRALVVAGAQTLVTSLWKVDDAVTRELMIAYYKNLLSGQGRVEALRAAALGVRKKHPEPRHWAPFIAVGQGSPLRGIR